MKTISKRSKTPKKSARKSGGITSPKTPPSNFVSNIRGRPLESAERLYSLATQNNLQTNDAKVETNAAREALSRGYENNETPTKFSLNPVRPIGENNAYLRNPNMYTTPKNNNGSYTRSNKKKKGGKTRRKHS